MRRSTSHPLPKGWTKSVAAREIGDGRIVGQDALHLWSKSSAVEPSEGQMGMSARLRWAKEVL